MIFAIFHRRVHANVKFKKPQIVKKNHPPLQPCDLFAPLHSAQTLTQSNCLYHFLKLNTTFKIFLHPTLNCIYFFL